ncbi:MAG: BamA/TamA family outer membrane protein [Planctomycetes bacterium]|jgi:outer membrane protein insertion porin family|nr:BamA/TamA family outer membrane protein [Planctomycetota bacterium]
MTARGRIVVLLAWCAAASCSVLEPAFVADRPDASGLPPLPVTLVIEGNRGIGAVALRSRAEDYLIDLSRDPTRESAVYDAAQEVEDFYRTSGYPVAAVRYVYEPPAEDAPRPAAVTVKLIVEEGPLVTVDLRIDGNAAFGTGELLALWARERSGTFGLGGVVFVEAQLHAFAEELREFYRGRGFLDVEVDGPRLAVDLGLAKAAAAITIEEGALHTIGDVEVAAPLREALGADAPPGPAGKPYARNDVFAWRDAVRAALRKRGHAAPRVEVTARPQADRPSVWNLLVDGEPGPVSTIATVDITGNDKTLDAVIRDQLDLEPGATYDGTEIDAALQRLYRTGLFRRVEIDERPVPEAPGTLGLDIRVDEADSRAVEFSGGYGSYERLRGGLRLEERNLFGTGRGIALDNRLSLKGYSTALTVTDQDFLFSGATLTVSSGLYRREEPSFVDEAVSTTVALTRPLVDQLTARVGYTYRDRVDAESSAQPAGQLVDYVEGKVFVELRNDQRDDRLFPRSGHAEFLAFERIAPLFGADVDLDRLMLRASVHIGLIDPMHLVLRSEQSLLWPHEGSARVPLQERWFNGGEASVRSFREAQLGPTDGAGIAIGGEYRNLFGVELRVPLWRTVEAGLFADAGNVGSAVQEFSLDDMRYALGAGLRLLLPIGPVRLDAAWNPDQRPGDEEWVLHFSVGYPF